MACQYDVVDDVAGNQGLGETQKRCDKDDEKAEKPLTPILTDIGTKIFQVVLDAGVAIFSGDPVLGEFSGQTPLQICKPAIQ